MHGQQLEPKYKIDKKQPNTLVVERSAALFKTLSNPHRLQILLLLKEGEADVQHIQEALHISQPLTSQHLKVLKNQGLLAEHRKGKHVYYGLRSATITQALLSFFQLQMMEFTTEGEFLGSLSEMLSLCSL